MFVHDRCSFQFLEIAANRLLICFFVCSRSKTLRLEIDICLTRLIYARYCSILLTHNKRDDLKLIQVILPAYVQFEQWLVTKLCRVEKNRSES